MNEIKSERNRSGGDVGIDILETRWTKSKSEINQFELDFGVSWEEDRGDDLG